MDTREFKALELAARAKIERCGSYWTVPSASSESSYRVQPEEPFCTCEDFELRRQPCKHILAVRLVQELHRGKPLPTAPATEDTKSPGSRPTYKQNWPKYNAAQKVEKRLFQELLADVCSTVPTYPPRTGRPPFPRCDAIFSAVFKVYSTFSGRRFSTDLAAACEAGYIDKAPHYNSVFRVLEDPDTTAILRRLILQSSLPLRSVESDFAVDSSGFSTSRFLRWFDHKYGVERRKAEWVKVHVACGVKTNVVTAVEVNDAGDCPLFKQLALTTTTNFTAREFSADKAYLSYENLELAEELGAVPYIAFKNNSRGDTRPGIWEKMHAQFILNRENFLKHYHKRSNAESTFSMIKAKFGDAVRSKTDTAMKNEVLAKILCHNLVVLVHEMHELGIEPKLADPAEPRVLKFPGTG